MNNNRWEFFFTHFLFKSRKWEIELRTLFSPMNMNFHTCSDSDSYIYSWSMEKGDYHFQIWLLFVYQFTRKCNMLIKLLFPSEKSFKLNDKEEKKVLMLIISWVFLFQNVYCDSWLNLELWMFQVFSFLFLVEFWPTLSAFLPE